METSSERSKSPNKLQGLPPMDAKRLREETRGEIVDVVKEHVLPLLPAKSLCRCRTVSKDWRQWLSNPFLAHKQTIFFRDVSGFFVNLMDGSNRIAFVSLCVRLYGVPDRSLSFLPELVDVKASCNGLLCCEDIGGRNLYYICNPVRQEWKVLPSPSYYHGPGTSISLAFEPGTLNFRSAYDLVCAIPSNENADLIMFEIYSSRSESWRLSDSMCDELTGAELRGSGLYLNGVLCWEAVIHDTAQRYVLTFNVMDELYGIIALPDAAGADGALTEIRGELCYVVPNKDPAEFRIYGGMEMSLKRTVQLEVLQLERSTELFRALACIDNGDTVLFLLGPEVHSYSISQREEKLLFRNENLDGNSRLFLHINSLVDVLCPPPIDM